MTWQDTLTRLGVYIQPIGPYDVTIVHGSRKQPAYLLELNSPLSPAKVDRLDPGPGLLILPRATETVIERARAHELAVVTYEGDVDLRALGIQVTARRPGPEGPAWPTRRGPKPWRSFIVVRRLLSAIEPVSQHRLAELAGVSQPSVHRSLQPLIELGLVKSRIDGGAVVTDHSLAIDWWVANYPGPGGVASFWTGLDPVMAQATRLVALCRSHRHDQRDSAEPIRSKARPNDSRSHVGSPGPDRGIAVSSDAATDLIAPWRQPSQAVVYADQPPSPLDADLVPSSSYRDATLVLLAPADPGVWSLHPWPNTKLPIADPLQVLCDLRRAPGADAVDAYQHLKSELLGPARWKWATASGHPVG